jgi:uncharacterized protein
MVVSIYAGFLALLYIALAIYVIRGRFQYRISLGDGGIEDMQKRIRAHANFAEYAPFAMLLLLVELANAPAWLMHGLGASLLIGRVFHAAAILGISKIPFSRQIGMVLTLTVIGLCALIIIWKYIVPFSPDI